MRRFSSLAVLALSSGLWAQKTTSLTVQPQLLADANCPVGLTARHASVGAVRQVKGAPKPVYRGFELSFRPRDGRAIAGARVTLFGMSGAHVIPAGEQLKAQRSESFTISPEAEGKKLFQSVVYAEKLTAVQWVQLDELTYADGTAWHPLADAPCRITPNGFMLVSE